MLAVKSDDEIKVYDAYLHKESIKKIEGRYYDSVDKAWCVPLTEKNVALLSMLGAELDDELLNLVKSETVIDGDEQPILPMRLKATPYKHQIRAYIFALKIFGMGGDANDI